jgi:hypothetical protein
LDRNAIQISLQRLSALICFRRVQEHFDNSRRINGETLTPGIHNKGGNMNSTCNPGRVAGLWYLLLIAIGPFFLIYIPGKLYVKGNAAATINNIAAHELLFRFGILAELIGGVILVFLVLAFYPNHHSERRWRPYSFRRCQDRVLRPRCIQDHIANRFNGSDRSLAE